MPPPHLHPRSRMTSSLFATTVAASFLVVALPHVLPCPAPRVAFADGEMMDDGKGKRSRADIPPAGSGDGIVQFGSSEDGSGERPRRRSKRECPVPKPGGMLGEWLGFHGPKEGPDGPADSSRGP